MEKWRKIEGIDNYDFSFNGSTALCRSGLTGKLLSNNPGKNKYIAWGLIVNGERIHKQAARWIALAFPELVQNEYFEGAVIDHIDTDTMNNHPSNLRWVSAKGNMNNPLTKEHIREQKVGNNNPMYGKELTDEHKRKIATAMTNNPLKSYIAEQYSKEGNLLCTYLSIHEAGRQTGISFQHIAACISGKRKTAGGFVWRYGEQPE